MVRFPQELLIISPAVDLTAQEKDSHFLVKEVRLLTLTLGFVDRLVGNEAL